MEATMARPGQPAIPGLMTEAEARAVAGSIRRSVGDLRRLLLEFEERRGYIALGYANMRLCAEQEFGWSAPTFYRQLKAIEVERQVGLSIGEMPEAHARELARLPAGERAEAYAAVGNGATAAEVRREVEARRREPEPLPEPPQSNGGQMAEPPAVSTDPADCSRIASPEAIADQMAAPGTEHPTPDTVQPPPLRRTGPLLAGLHGAAKMPKPEEDGRGDCFQTPPEALLPILPFLRGIGMVWECAEGNGNLTGALRANGIPCTGSDILTGTDFLDCTEPGFDAIVTNPPFSLANEFLARCYALGKPFALLMPLYALGSKARWKLFRQYGIQMILFPDRIRFETPNGKTGKESSPQFDVAWFCYGLKLPRDLVFWSPEDIEEPGDSSVCDRCGNPFPTADAALIGEVTYPPNLAKKGELCCPQCQSAAGLEPEEPLHEVDFADLEPLGPFNPGDRVTWKDRNNRERTGTVTETDSEGARCDVGGYTLFVAWETPGLRRESGEARG